MNILKTIELYALSGWLLWYENDLSKIVLETQKDILLKELKTK